MLEARVAPHELDDVELGDYRPAPVMPRENAPENAREVLELRFSHPISETSVVIREITHRLIAHDLRPRSATHAPPTLSASGRRGGLRVRRRDR